MASLANGTTSRLESPRFFVIMAAIMSLVIVAGFSLQLAMGRSSFAVPWPYHVHGLIFMGWIGLYLAQHVTAYAGNFSLHRRIGKLAYLWVPSMVIFGTLLMIVVMRRNGGPFFFHVSEFLWSNTVMLWCFGGLALWALRSERRSGWHRRLMLCAMAILTGPGIGRILPLPLMIPHAWTINTAATMIWPLIGMFADWRRNGRVHPAYFWGLGIYIAVFVTSMAVSHTGLGISVTESILAGSPGAQRPLEPFLPPGFSM